jgi:CheY-like chemotaxis protein
MILIVDDHKDTCEVLARLCARKGLPASYATSGQAALEHVRTHKPRVLLLDHMMPGTTGLDVLEQLHRDGHLESTKVLFLSAVFDHHLYRKALRLGAREWFVKGTIRLTDVVNHLARHCPQH